MFGSEWVCTVTIVPLVLKVSEFAVSKDVDLPKKIRDLITELMAAGFVDRGGKGSHRTFCHPKGAKPVTISGNAGDDAKHYQERAVRMAIEALHKT